MRPYGAEATRVVRCATRWRGRNRSQATALDLDLHRRSGREALVAARRTPKKAARRMAKRIVAGIIAEG